MSVILNRHTFGVFCELGNPNLTDPYYPGAGQRPHKVYGEPGSVIGYDNYPATTPDNIVKLIRTEFSGIPDASQRGEYTYLEAVVGGATFNGNVTAGFPPAAISGSPFNSYKSPAGAGIFPRWVNETAWDLKAFPGTYAFTPQGLTPAQYIYWGVSGVADQAGGGVSFDTGVLSNDPSDGGETTYTADAQFNVQAVSTSVCCWNEGAEIELNLEVWMIDYIPTAVAGLPGFFTYELGTPSYYATLTYTVVTDPSWATSPGLVVHTFTIPKVVGHFTFVNDFYVSSVTAP